MKTGMNWLLLFLIGCALSGCLNREILDELVLVNAIGFDEGEGEEIIGTIYAPVYKHKTDIENITMTTRGTIKKTILQNVQRESPAKVALGSLEVILFEDRLAEKGGILELVDAFQRDPAVGTEVILVITEGKTQDLLAGEYGVSGNADFILRLMENNITNENIPNTNLQLFLSDFYKKGKSPFLPIIRQKNKYHLEITGVALLHYGKMVAKVPGENLFFFKLMTDEFTNGLQKVEVEEGTAAIQAISSKRRMELTGRNPYEVTLHIKVEGIINEFTGKPLDEKLVEKIERKMEQDIKKKGMELFQQFKKAEVDPVGFGHFVKTRTRGFDFQKWREEDYQNMKLKFKVDVNVKNTGIIE